MLKRSLQKRLIKISRDSINLPIGRTKHFSFLLRRSRIVGFGWNNTWKTHPLAYKYGHRFDCTHSEIACISTSNVRFSEFSSCVLVNVRLLKNKQIALSRPCSRCLNFVQDISINTFYYTNEHGEFEKGEL